MDRQNFEYLRNLPKAELHLHLEGAASWQTIRKFLSPASKPFWLSEEYFFKDLKDFLIVNRKFVSPVLKNPTNFLEITRDVLRHLVEQKVKYVELNFSPFSCKRQGTEPQEALKYIVQAVEEFSTRIYVRLVLGLGRQEGPEKVYQIAKSLLKHNIFTGIDLHGDEKFYSPKYFKKTYDLAKEKGLKLKAHAGECMGPESIREAIDELNVSQIGHGISCIEDKNLMMIIKEKAITLEVCPISNYKLRIVKKINEHPVRQLFERGLLVTVNTDDPLLFNNSLYKEYENLILRMGFSYTDIIEIISNAFQCALLPLPIKKDFVFHLCKIRRKMVAASRPM